MRRTCLLCVLALVAASPGFAAPAPTHEPLAFTVNITLSPRAAARLRATHEGITASASYYGNPTGDTPGFLARSMDMDEFIKTVA